MRTFSLAVPPEEETGQNSEEFPPLDEHDDDMEDLEQSSKRQKSASGSMVFSSDLVEASFSCGSCTAQLSGGWSGHFTGTG